MAKAVKRVVSRGRPAVYLGDVAVRGAEQVGLGYPEGHLVVAAAMAAALTADVDGRVGVAAFAAGSRVYVGAHFLLDSPGGALLGDHWG